MKQILFSLILLAAAMPLITTEARVQQNPYEASSQDMVARYNKAYSLPRTFARDSVFHWAQNSAWCDSSYVLHYEISTPQGRKYISFDAAKGTSHTYASYQEMEKALKLKKRPEWKPQFGRKKQRHWMEVDEENDPRPVVSPDGKQDAFVEEYNVVIHNTDEPYSNTRRLTQDGTIGKYYSNRIQWSPDGKYILVCKRRPVEKRYVYYVESSPSDQLQPKLHKQEYAKPGDELPQHYPVIIEVATGKAV